MPWRWARDQNPAGESVLVLKVEAHPPSCADPTDVLGPFLPICSRRGGVHLQLFSPLASDFVPGDALGADGAT